MEEARIESLEQLVGLWTRIYESGGKPDWSHILPYYDRDIAFKDSIQEIRGIEKFTAMTERLTERSRDLEFIVHAASMSGDTVFLEWEMIISYKRYPRSSVYGASRLALRDGRIVGQRDYYDLWGDILDNIPFVGKAYRSFMRRRFG